MYPANYALRELLIAASDWWDAGDSQLGEGLVESRERYEAWIGTLLKRIQEGEAPPNARDVLHSLGWASRQDLCDAFGSAGDDVEASQESIEPRPASLPGSGVSGLMESIVQHRATTGATMYGMGDGSEPVYVSLHTAADDNKPKPQGPF